MYLTSNETRNLVRYYQSDCWGNALVSKEEHIAACERAEAWLTAHEGDDLSIRVRPCGAQQVEGLYHWPSGHTARYLDSSDPELAERVENLLNRAYQHALDTWPAI